MVDITKGSAGYRWDGHFTGSLILHQRVAATVAKPLVNATTYNIIDLPAGTLVKTAWYIMRTPDTGGGTITVNAYTTGSGTTFITTGASSGAAASGVVPANTAVMRVMEIAGTIDIVIGTANLTTAVFDLFVEVANCAVTAQEAADIAYAS